MSISPNMQNNHKNFIILLIADAISSFGSSLTAIALTLYIYRETNSLLSTSMLPLLSILPKLIITPLINKINLNSSFKRIFFIGELLAGIIIANLLWVHNVTGILLVYISFVSIFFILEIYRAEFLKQISSDEEIYKRQSVSRVVNITITIIAPLTSGILLSKFSINLIFIIDIITYVFAALMILSISDSLKPYNAMNADSPKANLKEKLSTIRHEFKLTENTHIYAGSILISFIGGATSLLTLSYIVNFLKISDYYYGILMSFLAIGSVIGTFLINIPAIKRRAKEVSSLATLLSGFLLLTVFFQPSYNLLLVILTVSGILGSLVMIYYASELFIRYNHETIRNRYAIMEILIDSSTGLSKPFAGFMEKVFGAILSLIIMGIVFITFSPLNFISKMPILKRYLVSK